MPETTKKRSRKYAPRGVEILHEDRDLFVVCKAVGVLSTGTRQDEAFTAENVLSHYLRKGCSRSSKQVYLVHRLDRETSGVMVFAKTAEAQHRLQENWSNNEKIYYAALRGHLKARHGTLTSYLADGENLLVYTVKDATQGKLSQTAYEVVAENATMSLVKIHLLTGRRNQIRVQFADIGHPVVGDPKYGRNDPFRERLCLHAKAIAFNHPHSGERLSFDTPLPQTFFRLFPHLGSVEQGGAASAPSRRICRTASGEACRCRPS
ncbi:MAG: RluA family pseudouridine synthase [Lentisphaerae bacterium]|nr:RluA family pseudouridine synthase [Lentisphaerota bacterium]